MSVHVDKAKTLERQTDPGSSSDKLLKTYLLGHSSIFAELHGLKQRGWSQAEGDHYFQARRDRADNPDNRARWGFFNMTLKIGDEMARRTGIFDLQTQVPAVLDLCMAPGGFTQSVINQFPKATVHAITLPPDSGGYHVMAAESNVNVLYADITMFAAELGVTTIPDGHPDAANFNMTHPYSCGRYDLVFCGGAVVRSHERMEYRSGVEGTRLTLSQLILAFNRIKPGGTLVLLLHRLEAWDTARLIYVISTVADIQLFKPRKAHAIKSSFYLVAKNIQSDSQRAVEMVSEWKRCWFQTTFGSSQEEKIDGDYNDDKPDFAALVLKDFGPRLVQLGEPVWKIQAQALRNLTFVRAR